MLPVSEPFVALVMELKSSKLPLAIIAGTSAKSSIELIISNNGNVSTDRTATVSIEVGARSLSSGAVYAVGAVDLKVGGLAAGKSKNIKLPVEFPADIPEDNYEIVVSLGNQELVIEGAAVALSEAFVALGMEVVKSEFPSSIIAGTAAKSSIELAIVNSGNVATDRSAVAQIRVVARSLDDGNDYLLTEADLKVGGLKPSASKKYRVAVSFPADVPDGDYSIVVTMDGMEAVVDGTTVAIREPFVELEMELKKSNVPSAIVAGSDVDCVVELGCYQ